MPSDIREAERMLNLFTSVGARSFVVTKLDIQQVKIWAKTYSATELREKLPAMVRTAPSSIRISGSVFVARSSSRRMSRITSNPFDGRATARSAS